MSWSAPAPSAPSAPPQPVSFLEVYGFVAWISTHALSVIYLAWALCPEHHLQAWGVAFLPSKYWAVAVPAWLSVALVTYVVAYGMWNLAQTPAPDALSLIIDPSTPWWEGGGGGDGAAGESHSQVVPEAEQEQEQEQAREMKAAATTEVPVGGRPRKKAIATAAEEGVQEYPPSYLSRIVYGGMTRARSEAMEAMGPLRDVLSN